MNERDISQNSSALRSQACNLAAKDWTQALAYAEQINDPWYACQAFAWCGRFAPASHQTALLDRAFNAAQSGKDAYQQLAAAAWPLRALVETGQPDRASREFDRVADIAGDVKPPSSRAEACLLVYEALAPGGRELGFKVLRWLLSQSQPAEHWRQKRAIITAAIQSISIEITDRPTALTLVSDDSLKRQIEQRLDRGLSLQPRDFFWPQPHT